MIALSDVDLLGMLMEQAELSVEVPADGDELLGERLARSLRAELNEIDGVRVRFAEVEQVVATDAKGGSMGDAALWISLGTATTWGARVVLEGIRAWSARHRNRTVRITSGDQVIEIPGSPDAAQERLAGKFIDGGGE